MSLIIAPKHTKTISDIYENILFEFPENTLLDNILPDLWSEILKYQVVPFIIGDPNLTYPGFHLISKDEFLDCVDDIMEYYHSNKGISNVFDLDTKTNFHFLIGDHYAVNMAREIEWNYDKEKLRFTLDSKDFCDEFYHLKDKPYYLKNFLTFFVNDILETQ